MTMVSAVAELQPISHSFENLVKNQPILIIFGTGRPTKTLVDGMRGICES